MRSGLLVVRGGRWPVVVVVASGAMLNPLNSSTMAVAVVDMQAAFGADFREASLLISVFYLASAVGQPVMGRLADRYGRRRFFLCGLLVVVVASIAAPFAPNLPWLVAARAIQALGTSTLYPAGLGIVRAVVHDRQAYALSVIAAVTALAAALGPTLAGLLVSAIGWWGVFAINAPIGLVVLAGALIVLPRDGGGRLARAHRTQGGGWVEMFDLPGVTLFVCGLLSLLWFLMSVATAPTWWLLAGSAGLGVLLVVRERRARDPIIDVRALASNHALLSIYLVYTLVNLVFYTVVFGMPSFLRSVQDFSPLAAGLIMLPISGVGLVTLPVVARVIDKLGPARPLAAGYVVMTVASVLLFTLDAATPLAAVLFVLAMFGIANGINNLGLSVSLYDAARAEDMSAAAGLFQTARYFGAVLATSLLGIVFSSAVSAADLNVLAVALVAVGVGVQVVAHGTARRLRGTRSRVG